MKYKLIAGAIASVLTIGGLSLIPFKEVNIDPQIESINNSTTIVSKAKDVIEKLGSNVTELSNRNRELVTENENLKEEINNGSGNSEMNYKNPPNNPDFILGKAGGEEFKSFIGAKVRIGYFQPTVEYYYNIKCTKQFVAFYNYIINSDVGQKSDQEIKNIKQQNEGLYLINSLLYNEPGNYIKKFYGYLDLVIDNKNQNTFIIPESERLVLENISLPSELQNKLDKCFDLYADYCKNNILTLSDVYNLNGLIMPYKNLMMNAYLKEYYTYLYNNYELANFSESRAICNSKMANHSALYNSNVRVFNKKMDDFIKIYEK